MMKRYRADLVAYHKTPEYQKKQRRKYEARRRLKKVYDQLNHASSYKEVQRLQAEADRLYSIGYFDGKSVMEYMSQFDHLLRK